MVGSNNLGVAHLADLYCQKAFEKGAKKGLGLAERDYLHESLMLAGLCHDLGHGPFSHTFDSLVIPSISPGLKWSHEVASEMLLDDMIDTYNIDMEMHQLRFIKGLIAAERREDYGIDWIYEVISSKKYGMDVDRFDYMMRDPLHTGQKDLVFHPNFYLDNFEIINNSVVFNIKIANKIFEFFNHRYKLFKNMYLNRKSVGIEYMIGDLFKMVNDHFHFEEIIFDPKKYLKCTNNIMFEIENLAETRPDVKKLVNRLYHRENYKFVNEYICEKSTKKRHSKEDMHKIKELFIECQPNEYVLDTDGPKMENKRLDMDNVIIGNYLFKYCEENQFDSIQVLGFDGEVKPASALPNLMNINKYYEYQIHCYVRDSSLYPLAKQTWIVFVQKYSHLLRIE